MNRYSPLKVVDQHVIIGTVYTTFTLSLASQTHFCNLSFPHRPAATKTDYMYAIT